MNEQEIADLFISEMRAFLPIISRHLAALNAQATVGEHLHAAHEVVRLSGAVADLCRSFHVTDCGDLFEAVAETLQARGDVQPIPGELLRDGAAALAFVEQRINNMASGAGVGPASESESATAKRLLASLRTHLPQPQALAADEAHHPSISQPDVQPDSLHEMADVLLDDTSLVFAPPDIAAHHAPDPWSLLPDVSEAEPLTGNDLAMVQLYQRSHLRRIETGELPTLPRAAALPGALKPAPVSRPLAQSGEWPPLATERQATPAASSNRWAISAEELDQIPPEMKRMFILETTEDLQDAQRALLELEQHPDERHQMQAMSRIGHKIKGAAATLGFDVVATLAAAFEDVLRALQAHPTPPLEAAIGVLIRCLTLLQRGVDEAGRTGTSNPSLALQAQALRDELLAGVASSSAPPALAVHGNPVTPLLQFAPLSEHLSPPKRTPEGDTLVRVDVHHLDELMNRASALTLNRATLTRTRSEISHLLDEMETALGRLTALSTALTDMHPLVREAIEQATARDNRPATSGVSHAQTEGAGGAPGVGGTSATNWLARLRHDARAGASGSHVAGQAGVTTHREWDDLELERYTEFDHSLRSLSESVADVTAFCAQIQATLRDLGRTTETQEMLLTQIHEHVVQMRLVPLRELLPRVQLAARVLAGDVGKSITFNVRGELTEIDRGISEALVEPLTQLVRNAVVHGIETPEERREQGKPEVGTIWLHAYYVGSEVTIEIGDDGAGVNPDMLLASGIAAHKIDDEYARRLTREQALELMFVQGISTLGEVRLTGGGGIGLDEVRSAVHALKGTILVRSEPGHGTVFSIRVPISLSTARVLNVCAGAHGYAIPFASVERSISLRAGEILVSIGAAHPGEEQRGGVDASAHLVRRTRLERSGEVRGSALEIPPHQRDYEEVPVFSLGELLGVAYQPREPQPALVIETGRQRAVILVDEVRGDCEVVVRTLPPHLRRLAVRGTTVTPDGQVLLLLDIPELLASSMADSEGIALGGPRVAPHPAPRFAQTPAPRVLVVDDSLSMRRTLEAMLTRAGFEVQLARDGIEALQLMAESLPRVVVLDVEMPRLDGFELLAVLRGSAQFAGVRVAMLTTRAAEKHRAHARSLGADAYLVKPTPPDTLISTINDLLSEASVRP